MAIEFRTGDLFALGFPALAHGVNCQGQLGGLALHFAHRWPDMADAYVDECSGGRLTLGGMFVWTAADGTVIYNLATQLYGGPNAELGAIESSLRSAVEHAEDHEITSIGLPRIGAGIGGLEWEDVQAVITSVAAATDVRLVVVSPTWGPIAPIECTAREQSLCSSYD